MRGRSRATGFPLRCGFVKVSEAWSALFILLLMLLQLCASAPQDRTEITEEKKPSVDVTNPFGPGDEERRLLQSYIRQNLQEGQPHPDLTNWEQEIFFLFSLHDYDKSGQMDGLEMMTLLSDFLSHHSQGPNSADSVISLVDSLLQAHDQNQDGMLDPSELLAPPMDTHVGEHQVPAEKETDASVQLPQDGAVGQEQRDATGEQVQEKQEEQEQEEQQQETDNEVEQNKEKEEETQVAEEPHPAHQGQPEI